MPVLKRKELEDSPLADLHAIASELGLESYRRLRKADLVDTILETSNGSAADDDDPARAKVAVEEEREAAEEEREADEERPARRRRSRRGGGRGRKAAAEADDEDELGARSEDEQAPEAEPEPADEETVVSGLLDVLPNGSGFLRAGEQEAYVSPAQIRRCELRPGDELSGPVRPPRRNERHASLIRVDSVNGREAEPPEERPEFDALTPVFPTAKLKKAPKALKGAPVGRGSRVAVAGGPGAGATSLLRDLTKLYAADKGMSLTVVLAGVRPEELAGWREVAGEAPIVGGSFERSPESLGHEAELAIERAKRVVERGGHAAVVVDSLAGLPAAVARRVFAAGRALEEGGTLTLVAAVGDAREPLRWATTRVVLEDGAASGTLNASSLK